MGRGKKSTEPKPSKSGAGLGFEEKLWAAADKLRGHMDAGEYKHVALGLIFLKYISDAFAEQYEKIAADPLADPSTATNTRLRIFSGFLLWRVGRTYKIMPNSPPSVS